MNWETFTVWTLSLGEQYGVNPLIFALLYFGTIPLSIFSFAWLARNLHIGKPLHFPLLLAFLSFIGTYVYLFAAGKNIPVWIYGLALSMMGYSGKYYWRKMRLKMESGQDKRA